MRPIDLQMIDLESEPARPEMTIVEAAAQMEQTRRTQILVRDRRRFVGILTEVDIVRKVLGRGQRPDTVRVADIMQHLDEARDGALRTANPPPRVWDPGAIIERAAQGKCDGCTDFCVDLLEHDGLLLCGDCRDTPLAVA